MQKIQSIFTKEEIERFRNDTIGCNNVNHLNNAGASLMPNVVTQSILEHIKLVSEIGGYEAAALKTKEIQQFYIPKIHFLPLTLQGNKTFFQRFFINFYSWVVAIGNTTTDLRF